MFLARISCGRSIRQFVVGVILIPTTVSLIWFVVFGGV
jgi:choline-glycine betaine transporter